MQDNNWDIRGKTMPRNFGENGGCIFYLFEKRDAQWHLMADFHQFAMFVTDEKMNGYRTLYSERGSRFRWDGTEYVMDCPEDAPADISDDLTSTCFRYDRWLREKNEPREPWSPAK